LIAFLVPSSGIFLGASKEPLFGLAEAIFSSLKLLRALNDFFYSFLVDFKTPIVSQIVFILLFGFS
jgi:hypothetical protein